MAMSKGFGITESGVVTPDSYFGLDGNGVYITTLYICCLGASGVLVYENSRGEPQVTGIATGQTKQIFCRRVLSSAIINTVLYTTTAGGLYWDSDGSS